MTMPRLQIVSLGSAKALTQDLIGGEFTEVNLNDSREPPAG